MRAVLDPNVLISSVLSPSGSPARLLRAWLEGSFELVVSQLLLSELARALEYPKLRRRIPPEDASAFVEWLGYSAELVPDPKGPPSVRSPDPDDDYLISLAEAERAALVSGDSHLLGLAEEIPVYSVTGFLEILKAER